MIPSPVKLRHRILVVDSHPIYAEGLGQLISCHPDLELCGSAATPDEALQLARKHQPGLVIVSLELNYHAGLELVRALNTQLSGVGILAMADAADQHYVERSLRAGAGGFVLKTAPGAEVLLAIRAVLEGKMFLQSAFISPLLRAVARTDPSAPRAGLESLTDRELRVLQLLGDGLPPREVARQLNVSPKTIASHRENIKSKLELKTAAELTRFACTLMRQNSGPRPTTGSTSSGASAGSPAA